MKVLLLKKIRKDYKIIDFFADKFFSFSYKGRILEGISRTLYSTPQGKIIVKNYKEIMYIKAQNKLITYLRDKYPNLGASNRGKTVWYK